MEDVKFEPIQLRINDHQAWMRIYWGWSVATFALLAASICWGRVDWSGAGSPIATLIYSVAGVASLLMFFHWIMFKQDHSIIALAPLGEHLVEDLDSSLKHCRSHELLRKWLADAYPIRVRDKYELTWLEKHLSRPADLERSSGGIL